MSQALPPPLRSNGRVLLAGGIVLTLDPAVGDFEAADVLVEDGKIVAIGPNLMVEDAAVVDSAGLVVMPGFIETHHHQYQAVMRGILPDGLLYGAWPQESYVSVILGIWTAGRLGEPHAPVWDLGAFPLDPEDVYLAELVSSLSLISQGVTMTADTSQSSHSAAYTDAMIQGLIDSGQRALYVYSGGVDRGNGFEFPGRIDDESRGIGRLAASFFPSKSQLVSLGANLQPMPVSPDDASTKYTGWQLARHYGAHITNHDYVGASTNIVETAQKLPGNGTDWSDVTIIHATCWQDHPIAQLGHRHQGYPAAGSSLSMQTLADRGAHLSISPLIEMQMGHGLPPLQMALNHGILPSLSPDTDVSMTPEPFSLMRSAFTLQRGLANDLALARSNPGGLEVPQLLTSRQVLEMMTIAGAAGNGVLDRVGTLTPGKEADIVFLDVRNLDVAPMHNVPGTVVTMMNQSHVRHVMIAGTFRFWDGSLVDVDVDGYVAQLEAARERALGRINGRPSFGHLPPGNNSETNPYRPSRFMSSSQRGQNQSAPAYQLRP